MVASSPQELRELEALLAEFEEEVPEKELELETLKAEIRAFGIKYLRILGAKYAELDRLKARIAELNAKANPQDQQAQEEAEEASAQAEETESAQAGIDQNKAIPPKFEASEALRKLFRQLAKLIHPDLASDEEERIRRTKLMAVANVAFDDGDEEKLRSIMADWEERPEAVIGNDLASQQERLSRKIEAMQRRLQSIEQALTSIHDSYLYRLKVKAEDADAEGNDLLADMVIAVEQEIDLANTELEAWV